MLKYWVWLSELKGLRNQTKLALLRRFGDPESIFYADPDELSLTEGADLSQLKLLENHELAQADRILADCQRLDIGLLTFSDAAYPGRLKNIYDPPVLLYYKGKLPLLDDLMSVAVVGTRDCTPYGVNCAEKLGFGLASGGAVVVSGLAKGIDAAATRGALRAGGITIGVTGNGLDVHYPYESRYLYEDVAASGVLLSEYPPGTEPAPAHFPIRNRIISGLSLAALVVEAPERSGALITAATALEQGRDVFAVPANLGIEGARGSNHLLREGALYTETGWDVAREYWHLYPNVIAEALTEPEPTEIRLQVQEKTPISAAEDDKKYIDKQKSNRYIDLHEIWKSLTDEEQTVVKLLETEPAHVDTLIENSQIPASRILATLTLLEVRGIVKRLPGRMFSLADACSE